MKATGKIDLASLVDLVEGNKIETVILGFTDHYGRMMGKRFDAGFFTEQGFSSGTHACNYLLTTDIDMEPIQGYRMANWNSGYGDFQLVPDMDTLRVISWQKKTAMVTCDVIHEKTKNLQQEAPRSILKVQLEKCLDYGYLAMGATELEYYLFEDSFRKGHEQNYQGLKPVGWYLEDYNLLQGSRTEFFHRAARRHLTKSGIPVENSKGEWGLGQHELNVRYAEVLEMADRHVIFKQCLKELADRKGISVTFMAKYHEDRAGSSCHIHLSLWKDEENAFIGDSEIGPIKASDEFRWFLGGWMQHVPEFMPFYAPTINAYKRYVDASWAPTRLAWSYDNRTAGFRVVGHGKALRIECRVPGADCNPYLAFAAALASGLDGIEQQIEPPEMFDGDAYNAQTVPRVPQSLAEANQLFTNSKFVRKALGSDVVDHFGHFFSEEVKAYYRSVTDWERKRYFEQI